MKAAEALNLLRVTRPTLTKYVKENIIAVKILPTGRYEYDDKSVYDFLNKNENRKTYIYARVSSSKHKTDLENQIKDLKAFCCANGYVISGIYTDTASDISYEKRKGFIKMLDDVLDNKVERIVVAHKDALSKKGYELVNHIMKKYKCNIVAMNETDLAVQDNER